MSGPRQQNTQPATQTSPVTQNPPGCHTSNCPCQTRATPQACVKQRLETQLWRWACMKAGLLRRVVFYCVWKSGDVGCVVLADLNGVVLGYTLWHQEPEKSMQRKHNTQAHSHTHKYTDTHKHMHAHMSTQTCACMHL